MQPSQKPNDKGPSKKLKPHFYKFKKGNDESKLLDLEAEMMFDQNNELGQSYNNSPDKSRDNFITGDMRTDYSMMVKSMLAKAKKQKISLKKKKSKRQQSKSAEPSPSKNKQQTNARKVLKMKLKVPKAER